MEWLTFAITQCKCKCKCLFFMGQDGEKYLILILCLLSYALHISGLVLSIFISQRHHYFLPDLYISSEKGYELRKLILKPFG